MFEQCDFSYDKGNGLVYFKDFGYFPVEKCDCSCCEYWSSDGCAFGWSACDQAIEESFDDFERKIFACFCPDFFPDSVRFSWRKDGVLEVHFYD